MLCDNISKDRIGSAASVGVYSGKLTVVTPERSLLPSSPLCVGSGLATVEARG